MHNAQLQMFKYFLIIQFTPLELSLEGLYLKYFQELFFDYIINFIVLQYNINIMLSLNVSVW